MPASEELHTAWGSFLDSFEWDAWCTLTFRPRTPRWYRDMATRVRMEPCPDSSYVGFGAEGASAAFVQFGEWLGESNPDVGWFYAHEVGRLGRSHLHGLIGGLQPFTRRHALWAWWHKRFGRAQILPFDPERGAVYYISKYMTKGDLDHYDIRPPAPKRRLSLLTPRVSAYPRRKGSCRPLGSTASAVTT